MYNQRFPPISETNLDTGMGILYQWDEFIHITLFQNHELSEDDNLYGDKKRDRETICSELRTNQL